MTYQEEFNQAYSRNRAKAIYTVPTVSPEGDLGRWNCQIVNSHGMGTCKESAYKDALHSMLRK